MKRSGVSGGVNIGFAFGVAASVLAFFTSPAKVTFVLAALLVTWFVFSKPEFGVVLTSFLIPFSPTWLLILCIAVTGCAFAVKLLRKKRFAKFETLDASVLALLTVILLGSLASVSSLSASSSVMYSVLLCAYFLAVNLLKTKQWLDRTASALVIGACGASCIYSISVFTEVAFPGFIGNTKDIFSGSVLSSALSGDGKSMVLMCVAALPIALSPILSPFSMHKKVHGVAAVTVLLIPIVISSSVRPVIALIPALIILFMICSRKSLFFLFSGAVLIPVLSFVFPDVFSGFFDSFVRGVAKVFEMRLPVWTGMTQTNAKYFLGGIGFGGGSWNIVYPGFSTDTVHAVHSYNTFYQMFVETGMFGLIILLVFIWLFISSSFTAFDQIDNARKAPALRSCGIKVTSPDSLGEFKHSKESRTDKALSVNQYCASRRMGIASPMCSVTALIIFGLFDYIWYDEKIFLMFWIAAGLTAAYVRATRKEIYDIESSYQNRNDPLTFSETDIGVR